VSSPCFPLAPNPRVAWPLLGLALLDLGVGGESEEEGRYWGSAVLAGVHVGAVIGVVRGWFSWAGVDGLCVAPRWGEL